MKATILIPFPRNFYVNVHMYTWKNNWAKNIWPPRVTSEICKQKDRFQDKALKSGLGWETYKPDWITEFLSHANMIWLLMNAAIP